MFFQNMGVGQTGHSDHELGESEGCSVWSRFTKKCKYSIFMRVFGKPSTFMLTYRAIIGFQFWWSI